MNLYAYITAREDVSSPNRIEIAFVYDGLTDDNQNVSEEDTYLTKSYLTGL